MDADYALALQLQSELLEDNDVVLASDKHNDRSNARPHDEPKSLVDPYWEMTDPNPDVRALFLQFNDRFFWGRLAGVEVRWSPRMTLCAGLCCYEGRGGLCSVRLSVPLLQLRPRKDLIETLLHEMIHAYLFVTDNNKDHDGHGPEFHKHMYRINNEAGTNISVYHNFHDEVEAYRQHWWRCDGPCRSRKPYFGYVKRSMNRAPSKNDTWWAEHQRTCGGTYTKVKEPENYGKKKGKSDNKEEKKKDKEKSSVKSMDIRIFAGNGKILSGNKKVVPSATISVVNDNSRIPTPSTSQNVPKVKLPSETGINKPNFTSKKSADKKSSSSGNNQFLPGGKTPPKAAEVKNKPVSQGGVAKFGGKQSKLQSLDFSDSDDDDDDDILLGSIPLDKVSDNSVEFSNTSSFRNFDDTRENMDSSGESDYDMFDFNDETEVSTKDEMSIVPPTNETSISKNISDSVKLSDSGPLSGPSQSSDADDVRAMLRKVWGQKHFGNNSKLNGISKDKTNVPGNLKDTGGRMIDGKLNSGVNDKLSSPSKSVISSNKRLSDTDLDSTPPMKRHCIEDDDKSSSERFLMKEENTKHRSGITSPPFDKYFSKVNSVNSHDRNTSGSNWSTNFSNTTLKNSSSAPMTNSIGTQSKNSVNAQSTSSGSEETIASYSNEGVNNESSTCPVCNTQVPISTINDHLDLCLTMQIL